MNGWAWFLVVYFAFNGLGSILLIGKPRDPITPGSALVLLVLCAGLISAVCAAVGVF